MFLRSQFPHSRNLFSSQSLRGQKKHLLEKPGMGEPSKYKKYLAHLWNEPCLLIQIQMEQESGAKEKGTGQGLSHLLTPLTLSKICGNSKERQRQIMVAGEMEGADCQCRCDLSLSHLPGMELCPLTSCIHLIYYSAKIYGGKVKGKEDTRLPFL